MVVENSKLKNPEYKPELSQTDMTSVYKTCENSRVGHVRTCHSPRIDFCLYSLLCKRNFQNNQLIFPKYCHDADHMYNKNSLKIFIGNQFFAKKFSFTLFVPNIVHYHPRYCICCEVKDLILELTKIILEIKIIRLNHKKITKNRVVQDF